jgi:hypothetical protein
LRRKSWNKAWRPYKLKGPLMAIKMRVLLMMHMLEVKLMCWGLKMVPIKAVLLFENRLIVCSTVLFV